MAYNLTLIFQKCHKGHSMNILVIENEEFLAENLCRYLKKIENLNIKYATSAQEALQLLSKECYDLIISDLWLSDAEADDWLLRVGEICQGQSLIITSAYPIPEKVRLSNKLNIIAYFEKPFDIKIVANLINHLNK